MKKIFIVVLVSLFVVGMCGIVDARTRVDRPTHKGLPSGATLMESGGTVDVPVKTFRMVRYYQHYTIGSQVGSAGKVDFRVSNDSLVVWDTSSSGDDGVTVTLSNITGDSRVAGVLKWGIGIVSTEQIGQTTYASQDVGLPQRWAIMQTYGPCYANIAGSITSGDAICAGAIPGTFARFGSSTNAKGTLGMWGSMSGDALYKGMAGFALDNGDSTYPNDGATTHVKVKVFLRGLN